MNNWICIEETNKYPVENETVWLYNSETKHVLIGCYVYVQNEGWFWAISNNSFYAENRKIVTEADIDDDYEITHWHTAPLLPQ